MPKENRVEGFRPLTGLILKSLSDSLRPYFADRCVLDLYAGAGSFGIAALKGGAASVTFVENNKAVLEILRANLKHPTIPNTSQAKVVTSSVPTFLTPELASAFPFNLVFADPPFALWKQEAFDFLFQAVKTSPIDSIFIVRSPTQVKGLVASEGYSLWKDVRFGDSRLQYFRKPASAENES